MRTFRQYLLTEMPKLDRSLGREQGLAKNELHRHRKNDEMISTTDKGHRIIRNTIGGRSQISAVDADDKVHMTVHGYTRPNGSFSVHLLHGNPTSTIKAHEFYAHLVTHHHDLESSGEQTAGGAKVWRRLSQSPGVHVTHHNGSTEKEIKLHRGDDWKKNYGKNSYFRATKL